MKIANNLKLNVINLLIKSKYDVNWLTEFLYRYLSNSRVSLSLSGCTENVYSPRNPVIHPLRGQRVGETDDIPRHTAK